MLLDAARTNGARIAVEPDKRIPFGVRQGVRLPGAVGTRQCITQQNGRNAVQHGVGRRIGSVAKNRQAQASAEYLQRRDQQARDDQMAAEQQRQKRQEELRLARPLLLVDDDTMNFLWETATQVDTRVRLDPRKRYMQLANYAERQGWEMDRTVWSQCARALEDAR